MRTSKRRTHAAFAAAAAGALLLTAGCSAKSSGGGSSSGEAMSAASSSIVNPSAKKGGTLKLWSNQDVDSWDPARSYYGFAWDVEREFTQELLTYPNKPGPAGNTLQPELASAMPTVSNGNKTYTFHLKSGERFENGDPITSQDIKYGIERLFAQDVLPGGPIYLLQALDEGQKYPGPYKDKDPDKMGLKSVQTPDPKTIVFNLAKPDADFPSYLTMGPSAPVEPKMDTGAKYALHPESSGPYKFKSVTPGKGAVMVRNTAWNAADDPQHPALPDQVDFTVTSNDNTLDAQLLSNSADLDVGEVGLQQDSQAKAITSPALKKNTLDVPTGVIRFITVDETVAPFNNIHCRRAVAYAMDPTAMQTARGGPLGGGALAQEMLPPSLAGHDSYDPLNLRQGHAQVAKAKQELKLCGKPGGFSTTIAVGNNKQKSINNAVALQSSLKAVGIKAQVDQYDQAQEAGTVGTPAYVRSHGWGLQISGWGADYQTASGYLRPIVDGREILPSGNYNGAEINDPRINALIDHAARQTDPAKVAADYQKINHIVMDQAVYLPQVYEQNFNYFNPRLTNVFYSRAWARVSVAPLGVEK
jgi:peptide/nickel transport system substrate-binding protein